MLPRNLRVLYLHGFASGPQSRKARFFADRLPALGFQVDILDLVQDGFERLTLTRQLQFMERAAGSEPVTLIGSSLGGYLASIHASRHPQVERLILLAPAFNLYNLWIAQMGPEQVRQWRERGILPFYHYAEQKDMPLGFQFLEDAQRYPPFPEFGQPALLVHGRKDAVVPVIQSIQFAATHDNVQLVQLDAGHELTEVLPEIWERAQIFLT
jgi:uncharacterized protein